MKKIKTLSIAIILCLSLLATASCGGGNTPQDSNDTSSSKDVLFQNNVFENDKVKVEITKYEVIKPGDTTYDQYNDAENSEGTVIAFWYNATNKSEEDIDCIGAWMEANFKAVQDNDPNKVNELEISGMPDERFLETQSEIIKQGGTVECCMGYILDDETTPVTLIAENINEGGDYGTQEFEVSKASDSDEASPNESSVSGSNGDNSELSADFKKTMDDYEAWFDHYCEVMSKYKENPTDMELMSEMTDLLTEETEMLEQMESMNQSEMNSAELAYYVEVTARIEKKLLEVAN